jgi:hypothetical protein
MKYNYSSIKHFNEEFFEHLEKEIFWYDVKGIYRLNYQRLIEINLEMHPEFMERAYCGYKVRIIDGKHGELSSHTFYFDDYFNKGYPYEQKQYAVEKSYNGSFQWYDKEPNEILLKQMAENIFQYIFHFEQ